MFMNLFYLKSAILKNINSYEYCQERNKMMKKLLCLLLASICSLAFADDATFEKVTKEADKWGAYPASILLIAPTATVSTEGNQTRLTLNGVSKLAGITFNLHKKDRTFDAFPTKEFAAAWNVCNAMKHKSNIFRNDNVNAILIFDKGPENRPIAHHLSNAPLISLPHGNHRTIAEHEGIAKLMLLNARLNDGVMSFDVAKGSLAAGSYDQVSVAMECIHGGYGMQQ
jgi:hypothetical protein